MSLLSITKLLLFVIRLLHIINAIIMYSFIHSFIHLFIYLFVHLFIILLLWLPFFSIE